MSTDDPRLAMLDARMRGMLSGLDAKTGFEARVMQRIAARAAHADATSTDRSAEIERRRALVRRRLRRESWSNGITIAGIGVAAAVLVWRYSTEIVQWITAPQSLGGLDPMLVVGVTIATLGAGLWPLIRKVPGFRIG